MGGWIKYNVQTDFAGTEKLISILDQVGGDMFMGMLAGAVYAEAHTIMNNAKSEVPLRDGPLRASGTVEDPIITGLSWSITIGFGGAASAYALIQHENLSFHHLPGRKAKYLEDPVTERLPVLEKALAYRVEQYFNQMGM